MKITVKDYKASITLYISNHNESNQLFLLSKLYLINRDSGFSSGEMYYYFSPYYMKTTIKEIVNYINGQK
jgi:hypothetical protein